MIKAIKIFFFYSVFFCLNAFSTSIYRVQGNIKGMIGGEGISGANLVLSSKTEGTFTGQSLGNGSFDIAVDIPKTYQKWFKNDRSRCGQSCKYEWVYGWCGIRRCKRYRREVCTARSCYSSDFNIINSCASHSNYYSTCKEYPINQMTEDSIEVSLFMEIMHDDRIIGLGCKIEDKYFRTRDDGCLDIVQKKTWAIGSSTPMNWEAAKSYCLPGTTLPSTNDFKLLTRSKEVVSRFNFNSDQNFWSNNSINSQTSWASNPATGISTKVLKTTMLPVVCVHSETLLKHECVLIDDRFITQGLGCLDRNSQLLWSQVSDKPVSYLNSLNFCSGLSTDSQGNPEWRVPTTDELVSLEGDTGAKTHLNLNAGHWYRSLKSTILGSTNKSELVRLSDGKISQADDSSGYYAICVHK